MFRGCRPASPRAAARPARAARTPPSRRRRRPPHGTATRDDAPVAIRPPANSRRSAGASSIAAATVASFARTSRAARQRRAAAHDRRAPVAVAEPVRADVGVALDDGDVVEARRRAGRRRSARLAVSLPVPGLVIPVSSVTSPEGSMRTVEVSKPPTIVPGKSAASGVISKPIPMPRCRPSARSCAAGAQRLDSRRRASARSSAPCVVAAVEPQARSWSCTGTRRARRSSGAAPRPDRGRALAAMRSITRSMTSARRLLAVAAARRSTGPCWSRRRGPRTSVAGTL